MAIKIIYCNLNMYRGVINTLLWRNGSISNVTVHRYNRDLNVKLPMCRDIDNFNWHNNSWCEIFKRIYRHMIAMLFFFSKMCNIRFSTFSCLFYSAWTWKIDIAQIGVFFVESNTVETARNINAAIANTHRMFSI